MSKKVAIQGERASYYDQAAHKFFDNSASLIHCKTFRETFNTLAQAKADYALAAIENSLYGSINENYDLLLKHKFWIVGEVYIHIKHCLIGLPGAVLTNITEVYSQAPALGQCTSWLDTNLPFAERIEEYDTAGSVILIKKLANPVKAAIGSMQAAKLYKLKVLATGIETHRENYTRFVVLAPRKELVPRSNKTTLVLTTHADTKPGSLARALEAFARRNINLTMLQSRPILGKAWHYMFYVDVDCAHDSLKFKETVVELSKNSYKIIVLGSYKAGKR